MQDFFDQLFRTQPGAGALGWDEVLLYLILSFVLSQLLAWVYSWTHRGLSHSRSMVQSMVLISIIVTAVMLAVGNNLARAFGLFGALALIRFRTPVKDTRDTVFLFMAVGIGITLGTNNVMLAAICTAVFCSIAVYLAYTRTGGRHDSGAMLRFAMPASDEQEGLLRKILRHYCRSFALVHLREAGPDGMEFAYQIRLFDPRQSSGLVADMGAIPGVRGVDLLLQEQDEEI